MQTGTTALELSAATIAFAAGPFDDVINIERGDIIAGGCFVDAVVVEVDGDDVDIDAGRIGARCKADDVDTGVDDDASVVFNDCSSDARCCKSFCKSTTQNDLT